MLILAIKPCSHVNAQVFVCVKRQEWVPLKQVSVLTLNVCIFEERDIKNQRKTQTLSQRVTSNSKCLLDCQFLSRNNSDCRSHCLILMTQAVMFLSRGGKYSTRFSAVSTSRDDKESNHSMCSQYHQLLSVICSICPDKMPYTCQLSFLSLQNRPRICPGLLSGWEILKDNSVRRAIELRMGREGKQSKENLLGESKHSGPKSFRDFRWLSVSSQLGSN